MLIHVNDAVTLQGARALRQPLIIPYGIHQEYELQIVTGHGNSPVDVESRGCVKWTLTITPSPENPTKVLAYAVFAENIATGSYLRFDFAATSVEMYKHVAGNPATPAVLQLQGFTEEDAPATLVVTLPVALVTTAQQRLPVDLSTALMQELQLAVSVVGAAQREISKYAGESTDAADRAELAAINAHASEVNAEHSATAAGISAGNARESELAAETAQAKAETAQSKAEDAQTAAEAAQEAAETAQGKAEDAQAAAETAQGKAEDAQAAAETAQSKAEDAQDAAETAQTAAETAQGKAEDAQTAAEAAQTAAETAQGKAEDAQDAAEAAQSKAETAQAKAETAQGKAEDAQDAAEIAQGKAETAQGLAETAQGKAEDAQTAAEAAQTAAETAQGKAEDAQDAAEAAQTAAETAQGKAEDAQTAAETAQGKAEDAQQAAEDAQTAAETAQGKAEDAQTAAETAQTAAETAQGKAEDAQTAAEAAQGAAESAQTAAEGSEDAAAASAKLSESWAVGDTGVRDDEDTNNAKYWADQSRSFSPITKADKVTGGDTDGMVAGLDAEGNLTNSGIPVENTAQQDGYYKDMTVGQAENLIDVNATPTPASFDFRTTAGDVSIDEHGVATIDQINGSTEVQNQLVAPTHVNTTAGRGTFSITDTVEGDAYNFVMQGDTLAKNQLVPDTYTPKTVMATAGVVEIADGIAGAVQGLTMYGDAYVRNQLVRNGDFDSGVSYWTTAGTSISASSVDNGVLTASASADSLFWIAASSCTFVIGHIYAISIEVNPDNSKNIAITAYSSGNETQITSKDFSTTAGVWNHIEYISTSLSSTSNGLLRIAYRSTVTGESCKFRNVQLVDLTQLFNGDSTKINAISSWADLVAQYPEYASYVAYNAGEVVGVQPTVKANAYVRNQRVSNGDFSNGTTGWNAQVGAATITDGLYKLTASGAGCGVYGGSVQITKGHIYMLRVGIRVNAERRISMACISNGSYVTSEQGATVSADTWSNLVFRVSGRSTAASSSIRVKSYDSVSGDVHEIKDIQAVDLTALCYGNQQLIDSIQTWDDLVALVPEYANYVTYDTGTDVNTGSVTASAPLYGIGSFKDSENRVAGRRYQRITQLDMGSLGWYYNTDNNVFIASLSSYDIVNAAICAKYVFKKGQAITDVQDKTYTLAYGYITTGKFAIIAKDTSFQDKDAFKASLSGVALYYATSAQAQTDVEASSVTLLDGDNYLLRTDNGSPADFDLTYTGTAWSVTRFSSHTYLLNVGGDVSIVTGSGETPVSVGVDQVVDLTQLFNGVSARISAIAGWSDLVAVLPEYAIRVPYNAGEIVPSNPTWCISIYQGPATDTIAKQLQASGYLNNHGHFRTTAFMPVQPGQVITAYYPTGTATANGNTAACFYDTDKQYVSGVWHTDVKNQAATEEYTVPANCYYMRDCFKTGDSGAYRIGLKYQSALAPTTPLYAAGSANDTEDAVTGKYTRVIGSYVIQGNEHWAGTYDQPNSCSCFINLSDIKSMSANTANITSNMFPNAYLSNWAYDRPGTICTNSKQVHIRLAWSTLGVAFPAGETAATIHARYNAYFKALYDAGTPAVIYYEMETAVTEDVTPAVITLNKGTNTFQQTAGAALQAPLSVTYVGTDYAIQTQSASKYLRRINGEDSVVTGVTSISVVGGRDKVIDLTRWFGKGNEPTIDAFYKLYPLWKDYDIPYIPGAFINFKGTAIKSVFFNAYNNATGTAELLGGNQYQICGTYTSATYTDIWGNAETLDIDADGIFTPVNNGTLAVTGGNDTDTCVHLTWSGYKNYGEPQYKFEQYGESVRDLHVSTYFPDGMNGIGTVFDELHADKAVRRFGVVDLSTLTWTFASSSPYNWWFANINIGAKGGRNNDSRANIAAEQYWNDIWAGTWGAVSKLNAIAMTTSGLNLAVNNGSSTQKPTGYMVYELATPVVTPIESPLNLSYTADDFGTEQLVPQNTTTLVTTKFDGLIRYNLDFTRLGVHVSEIWNYLEDLAKNNADYARAFGYYKQMTVGLAENLIDIHATGEDRTFQFDTSCGETSISDDGAASVQVMKGSTVMWNQIWQNIGTSSPGSYIYTQLSYDTWMLTLKQGTYGCSFNTKTQLRSNRWYLLVMDVFMPDMAFTPAQGLMPSLGGSTRFISTLTMPKGQWTRFYHCEKSGSTLEARTFVTLYFTTNYFPGVRILMRNVQLYDLTLMFGFGREPQTYAEFLRRFPDPAYPAEVSRTVSFNGESIATIGFNQCDPDATHIRVLPQAYQITGPGTLNFYDTELPSAPVAVTYGSTIEPFGFYKNGTKWYRALLGIADYDSTKTYRVNDGVVYESQWYKCNTQIDAAEEFDASKWDAVTLEDALADNFLFTPLFIEPDVDGIFTPPTRGWLYYEGVTAETCIHFTWSGYRNGEHEDYWREEREMPVKQYFPDGMRGAESTNTAGVWVQDELWPDKAVQRFDTYTFTGNETWTQYTTSLGASSYKIWSMTSRTLFPYYYGTGASAGYANVHRISGLAAHKDDVSVFRSTSGSNLSSLLTNTSTLYVRVDSCDTLEKIQAFMAGRTLYYALLTPVVTPIDPPLNLTYKVADFGTEQLVPVADSTMPSTPFSGLVRYSTDFTRGLAHLLEDNLDERVTAIEDTLPELAHRDGVYQQMTVGNSYNMIDKHADGTLRVFTDDTSCGTASISDDGTADIQEIRGSTIQLQNMVADDYQYMLEGGDNGFLELQHTYAGEVQMLPEGRTYIPNQLVPDAGEQQDIALWNDHKYYTNIAGEELIQTGLSSITVTPGVDKVTDLTQMFYVGHEPATAEEMRMLYPDAGIGGYSAGAAVGVKHSVWTTPVFNQLVQNGDFSDGTTGWSAMRGTMSVVDNVLTVTSNGTLGIMVLHGSIGPMIQGHVYLEVVDIKTSVATTNVFYALGETSQDVFAYTAMGTQADVWTTFALKASANVNSTMTWRVTTGLDVEGDTVQLRNFQIVDLTLMFGAGHEPATKAEALEKLAQLGKALTQYQPYDATGTPVGGTFDMSGSDLELHGLKWLTSRTEATGFADVYDPVNGLVTRNMVKYTFTGSETTWTKVTDAAYPNGYYYRFDTNSMGQIYAVGAGSYPYLLCANNAFCVTKQGGSNQREHSMSVSATRYLIVCSSKTLDEIKAELNGTVIVYRKITSTSGTLAFSGSMPTVPTGTGYLRQIAGDIPASIMRAWYAATEYYIRLVANKYYWFRHNEEDSILRYTNRDTYIQVVAGQDQLAALECLVGTSATTLSSIEDLFNLYPYLRTLPRLPYGGPILNYKGAGIRTVGFNQLDITSQQASMIGWATTNVARQFEEGKVYVGFSASNTINTSYATWVSASASQVNFKARSNYGLLYPMRCFASTEYQVTCTKNHASYNRVYMCYYDMDGNFISSAAADNTSSTAVAYVFTTPANAWWMCFLVIGTESNLNTTRNVTNPCVHLTWSGYRNGDYETYWQETRDLDIEGRFPDGMNGISTVFDTVKSAGTVTQYNTYVFTGNESISNYSYGLSPVFYMTFSSMWGSTSCLRLEGTWLWESNSYMQSNNCAPSIVTNNTTLYICVPGMRTVAQMRAWLKDRRLIYRRAVPNPEAYDEPVNLVYKVADFGTEQALPPNPTHAMPTTTALTAVIRYNSDMARTITKLPKDYQSQDSMDDLNEQLGAFIGGVITKAWDDTDQKYVYTFTRTPTIVTLAAGTNAHTLQPNMSYVHAPTTAGVTYTLAVPSDTAVDNEIVLDVTHPSSGSVVFKQGNTTLSLQKVISPSAGSKWRYLCIYQFGGWKVYPIEVQ